MLNISTKALNRLSKVHFSKTLTELIADRIVIEAKRELYLTDKPVKAIPTSWGSMTSTISAGFSRIMPLYLHRHTGKPSVLAKALSNQTLFQQALIDLLLHFTFDGFVERMAAAGRCSEKSVHDLVDKTGLTSKEAAD